MNVTEALLHGEINVEGRLPWSSNYTFLCQVTHEGQTLGAVYKPAQGERPLSDFPPEIYRREVAAYELALALGWPNIPVTVQRAEAPFGPGSLQQFVDADFEEHYFTFRERPELRDPLIDLATFDVVANNADRKAGHCLLVGPNIYGIDNGLCFHSEPKLRTVIWDFGGHPVPPERLADLAHLSENLPSSLVDLLDAGEIEALKKRIAELVAAPELPEIEDEMQYPWPLV